MKKFVKVACIVAALGILTVSGVAFAQPGTPVVGQPSNTLPDVSGGTTVGGVLGLICRLTGTAFAVLIILTVVFVIWAAFQYLTSAGGDGVGKANKRLIFAAVAIVVALLARGFPFIIASVTGATNFQGCDTFTR